MKTLINDNDGFRTYVYLNDAAHPPGFKHLKITTQWLNAKNSQDEQKKYEILLEQQSMQNFINALTQ